LVAAPSTTRASLPGNVLALVGGKATEDKATEDKATEDKATEDKATEDKATEVEEVK
jgi:hypothetical protein